MPVIKDNKEMQRPHGRCDPSHPRIRIISEPEAKFRVRGNPSASVAVAPLSSLVCTPTKPTEAGWQGIVFLEGPQPAY